MKACQAASRKDPMTLGYDVTGASSTLIGLNSIRKANLSAGDFQVRGRGDHRKNEILLET
jgi:hypothetical protein